LAGKQNKTENGQGKPMTMKKLIIAIAVLGTMAHGIVCAESTTNQANGQPVPARRYDVAAYVWPAYQFNDERWNQIFKEGIGEWEIIRECKPGFPVGRGSVPHIDIF
jgi:hypothetical protein